MTIENRDIHSYNCDVYINHSDKLYEINISDGLEITWERKGVAGKCTFTIVQEEADYIEFEEGDSVRVRISQTWMFYGFIFTKNRSSDGSIKVTCYDQLRYLKVKESVVFVNKSVGEIVNMIANDRNLNKGTIRDSKYKIPSLTKENASYFDIIMQAIEMTTQATGEIFILYDRFGKLTLCPLEHMNRNVIIDATVIGDYDYESTIDKQTYNMVRVGYKSQKDGSTVYQTYSDKKNIDKWGMLQLTEKADNGFQAVTLGTQLLKMYNSKTRTLKIKKAMGANEVVAGAVIMVSLNLGDIVINNNMVVDAVTHRVEDGLYSMDLELIGGEFVSTRGVQGESSQKSTSGGNNETQTIVGATDWGHGITENQIAKALKGTRMGKYANLILTYSNAFKVDPALITAIILSENSGNPGRNNKNSKFYNNPLSNGSTPFKSIEEGLWAGIKNISVNYINSSGKYYKGGTISSIGKIYCPPGAANDINGTNHLWIPTVTRYYNSIAGHSYNPSKSGGGVKSEAEAKSNMTSVTVSGKSNSDPHSSIGNSTIEKAVTYAISRVGMSYSQGGDKNGRNSYLYHSPEQARVFDCSSLCYYSYMHAGFYGRPAGNNAFTSSTVVSNPGAYKLKEVPISQAKRGDILWKSGHLGLCIGNGATVEANSPKTGINMWKNGVKNFKKCFRPMI